MSAESGLPATWLTSSQRKADLEACWLRNTVQPEEGLLWREKKPTEAVRLLWLAG